MVEPWIIQTPKGPLAAWVDENNQNRWLSANMVVDDWRRLYIEMRDK